MNGHHQPTHTHTHTQMGSPLIRAQTKPCLIKHRLRCRYQIVHTRTDIGGSCYRGRPRDDRQDKRANIVVRAWGRRRVVSLTLRFRWNGRDPDSVVSLVREKCLKVF